jgi:hypothetical protein
MTSRAEAAAESLGPVPPRFERLEPALRLVREWAGDDALAIILGGSHATREAVWVELAGRAVTISDLDVYVIMPDPPAAAAARARWHSDLPGLTERLMAWGIAAPLEVAFTPPEGLARMAPRPAVLDLARSGRVVSGDPVWRERIPAWTARDIDAEERLLLVENRAFEMLDAHTILDGGTPLDALRRRHAVLKTALDLAGALCLASGHYPEGAAARVAWARGLSTVRLDPEPPWNEGIAWRSGEARNVPPAAAREEWQRTARCWAIVWGYLVGAGEATLAETVRIAARRARLRRRWRQAFTFRSRRGSGAPLLARLRHANAGTPQHRLNAAAAATVAELAGVGDGPGKWAAMVRPLGVLPADLDATAAAGALVRRWDAWVLDGQRTGSTT